MYGMWKHSTINQLVDRFPSNNYIWIMVKKKKKKQKKWLVNITQKIINISLF